MYKENDYLESVDDSTVIWRYMDFVSFYSLVVNKTLFFKRLDKYTDAFEGLLPPETIEEYRAHRRSIDISGSEDEVEHWIKVEQDNIASYKAYILSNSWSINPDENYAMWKIYLRGYSEGIAIRTTVGKLKFQLEASQQCLFYSGKVSYKPFSVANINQFTVATYKRPAYSYENEYRALILHQLRIQEDQNGKREKIPNHDIGLEIRVDIDNLIDQVYISPFSNSWFASLVKKLLQNSLSNFDFNKIVTSQIIDQ